ncbi:sensor histidine kinase [Pantoea ananatis]|uniref:sensor histidine kinase n=1 Tax=Pantoea ananas TaxID=553 RepID=UPI0023509770|nr:HAMP domain-containing sensor histidine kinase [Pantoea ananatis]MDC7860677.1 histidine kinase [Pantoea ananatis]
MRGIKASVFVYLVLIVLLICSVVFTIMTFNVIKQQYRGIDPNLDNYSTAEVLFLSFERTRTAAYDLENPDDFLLKKALFDSKLTILKNKSLDVDSFYYDKKFLITLKKLEAQSKILSRIYDSSEPGVKRMHALSAQMDRMKPILIDLQEIIYRIQIQNFTKMKLLIQDNSDYAEWASLFSVAILFSLISFVFWHISKLNSVIDKKNIFISSIYHELSGSIQKIQMSSEMIDIRGDVISSEKYLSKISYHSDKLHHQIKEILQYSKIEVGNISLNLSHFTTSEIADFGTSLFNEVNGNKLVVKVTNGENQIISDKQKLISIVHNLLDNANKNTIKGVVNLNIKLINNTLFIRVRDTGTGFDIKKLDLLFQPFNQGVKEETRQGLGLGLTIIKSYIKSLHGNIRVKSVIGKGSSFLVVILVKGLPDY